MKKTEEEILKECLGETRYKLNGTVTNKQLIYAMQLFATQPSDELPSDKELKIKIKSLLEIEDNNFKYKAQGFLIKLGNWYNSIASPLISSRDARINELEEALKESQIIMKNLKHNAIDSAAQLTFGGVSLDKALDTNWNLIKSITPPKN